MNILFQWMDEIDAEYIEYMRNGIEVPDYLTVVSDVLWNATHVISPLTTGE